MKTSYGPDSWSRVTLMAGLPLLLLATPLSAELKKFYFSGKIKMVDDQATILDGSVTEDGRFEGFYTFDTGAQDSNSDPTVGSYYFRSPKYGMVVKMGSYVFRTNPKNVEFLIELTNRPTTGDNYLLRSYYNICSQPLLVEHIGWQLDDRSGQALSGVALPAHPPSLGAFESSSELTVEGGGRDINYFITAVVDTIQEVPVTLPENPQTSIQHAIQLSWPSRLGDIYQVQSSGDLTAWADVGDVVLGDGETISRFFVRSADRMFYRAVVTEYPETTSEDQPPQ